MSTTWVLIANASQAKIFTTHKARLFKSNGHDEENLTEVKSLEHEASRKKAADLVSDRQGSYFGSIAGHGSYSQETDPKTVEADRFAKEIADVLNEGRVTGQYDDLVIFANSHFQGLLKRHMENQLLERVTHMIDKDYTHMKGRPLVAMVREHL